MCNYINVTYISLLCRCDNVHGCIIPITTEAGIYIFLTVFEMNWKVYLTQNFQSDCNAFVGSLYFLFLSNSKRIDGGKGKKYVRTKSINFKNN